MAGRSTTAWLPEFFKYGEPMNPYTPIHSRPPKGALASFEAARQEAP